MAKLTLQDVAAGFGSIDVLNANFSAIEAAFENTLSRDGSAPNQLGTDLDLNGHTIVNSGTSDSPSRVVSYQEMTSYVAGASAGIVVQSQEVQTSGASQTVFNLTSMEYVPGSHNLAVYVNGVRKFAPLDYAETDSDTITFTAGQTLGAKVQFVTNEFLGTVDLPTHTHPWSQVTNVPVYTTRWPDWTEVTGKPVTFTPSTHNQDASTITTGRLADARRGVYVQASQPSSPQVGDLWFW